MDVDFEQRSERADMVHQINTAMVARRIGDCRSFRASKAWISSIIDNIPNLKRASATGKLALRNFGRQQLACLDALDCTPKSAATTVATARPDGVRVDAGVAGGTRSSG